MSWTQLVTRNPYFAIAVNKYSGCMEGGAFYLKGYLGSQQTKIKYLTPKLGKKYEF